MKAIKESLATGKVAEVTMAYKAKVKPSERAKITSSRDAYNTLHPFYEETIEHVESFKVILMNRANKVLGVINVGNGGLTSCVADVRLIFQAALLANATALIISHNHPSGAIKPSDADDRLTNNIVQAGKIMEVQVLDHIILTPDSYYSYADEGKI